MPHHVALATNGGESGGLGDGLEWYDGGQGSAKGIRIVGLDAGNTSAGEAEPGKDRLGQRDGFHQAGQVVAWLPAREEAYRAGAEGEGRRHRLQSDLRHLVH